jgi:hypothetical protein
MYFALTILSKKSGAMCKDNRSILLVFFSVKFKDQSQA